MNWQTRILLGVGVLLFAGILFYNLFFTPSVTFVRAQPSSEPAGSVCAEKSGLTESYPASTDAAASDSVASDVLSADHAAAATVSINTASAEELSDALKGVGPVIAERIVAYREEHGPFQTKEELKNVKGIGEKIYAQIEPFLTLDEE